MSPKTSAWLAEPPSPPTATTEPEAAPETYLASAGALQTSARTAIAAIEISSLCMSLLLQKSCRSNELSQDLCQGFLLKSVTSSLDVDLIFYVPGVVIRRHRVDDADGVTVVRGHAGGERPFDAHGVGVGVGHDVAGIVHDGDCGCGADG